LTGHPPKRARDQRSDEQNQQRADNPEAVLGQKTENLFLNVAHVLSLKMTRWCVSDP